MIIHHRVAKSYIKACAIFTSTEIMPTSPPTTPDPNRPYSGFEELDLEDEPLTPNPTTKQDRTSYSGISPSTSFSYASPISQTPKDDPWRSSHTTSSSASAGPTARFSSSTADMTSPPKLERASTSTSTSKASASGSKYGPNDAAVLGVAVVDFNHLVSLKDPSANDQKLI